MAADKLSKRSKVSNDIPRASWDIQKVKKKKYSHFDSNTKSHISLEWDDKNEQVVSKKEQISIAQRELTPFLPYGAYQNVLGDVFEAPPELFELSNLTGLLSYEVWQTHLSVQEREFLTQFLPEGTDPHKVVHELLAGNNLHFGNLFPKWGASVCSGDYHPDVILRQEQHNKANKVAYYSELHEYHTKMIGSLQSWKERWTTSMNPDNFMQKTPRPKREFHKSGSSHETGLQHDLCATSGSSSWDVDNKSCNSDNGETLVRTDTANKYYNSSSGRSVARPKKGDKLRKLKIECGDGAKYMSYIKVSKEQHERVKTSMKQSNTSAQSRSLNNVLGNLDGFCVKPFEMFEEEERQKLHSYWLNLVKKDLPAGFENWKSWRSAKWQVSASLRKEMEEKWESKDGLGQLSESLSNEMEEKCESKSGPALGFYNSNNQDDEFLVDGQDEELEQSSEEQHVDGQTNDALLIELEENMEQNEISLFQPEPDINTENHETANPSSQDSDQHQTFCDVITESDTFPSSLPDYPEIIDHANASVSVEQFPPPSAASEIWPLAPLSNVYYHQPTPVTQDYSSVTQSSFILRRTDGGDSFFNPYVNQDRNELPSHSLYKDQNSHYPGPAQFPRNLTSSLPLDPRLNIQQNIYTDGVGHLLPLDAVSGWPGINLPMSVPPHHQVSQTWFSDNEVARDGWSGGVVPNHVDESLYSVLSECNGLRSGVSYAPTEMIQSGSFADIGRELVPPIAANVVPPQAARGPGTGFNYMSGNGNGQVGWMNLSRTLPRLWNDKNLG